MDALPAIKGTRDILPTEVGYWQRIESVARRILDQSVYQEIRTPILELTDVFVRGIGTATDVVGKEMFSFTTRGEDQVSLRPENTAGVVRAYIQHKLHATGDVQRLWYCGPMFRYERPQAGRQRQFHQLGIEVLGSPDPRADAEVIAIALHILTDLGLTQLKLSLNSVGDPSDRQAYRQALVDYLTPYQAGLDRDSQDRLSRNPLRILDSKDPRTREIVAEAPPLLAYLSDRSRQHFDQVQAHLQRLDISFNLDPCLVRGLDYYTHTAFEIQSDQLGAQATVCGGGRYDGLAQELGGPDTPAVGWAMGLERLVLLLQQQNPAPGSVPAIYLISRGAPAEAQSLQIAHQLRRAGYATELDLSGSAFGKQFKRASRSGAQWAVTLGDAEAAAGKAQLKNLATSQELTLPQAELISHLQAAEREEK